MRGIYGIIALSSDQVPELEQRLQVMNQLQKHQFFTEIRSLEKRIPNSSS
jgi:hypothetical protein